MTHRILLSAVAPCALLGAFAIAAHAAAPQRTFVSGGGNDANPCSLASPCRSFTAAITAVAAKGEVIVLDSAAYGTVTITKSVSLIAPSGIYAGVTVSAGDGITVNAPGGIVVLRGLSINGQGGDNGINLLQAERLRIENCVISNMGVDGVMHTAPGAELIVLDTIVRDNAGSGIGGDANASIVLEHVRSEHNGTNGFYLASLSAQASATIIESVFAFNGSNGIWIASTGMGRTFAQIERSVMSDNGGAGIKISNRDVADTYAGVTRNSIHHNFGDGVAVVGTSGSALRAAVSENAIFANDIGLLADGALTYVTAGLNNMEFNRTVDVKLANGGQVGTYSNNMGMNYLFGTPSPISGH